MARFTLRIVRRCLCCGGPLRPFRNIGTIELSICFEAVHYAHALPVALATHDVQNDIVGYPEDIDTSICSAPSSQAPRHRITVSRITSESSATHLTWELENLIRCIMRITNRTTLKESA